MSIKTSVKPNSSKNNKTGGWRTFKPSLEKNKCLGCGLCASLCPEGAITMVKKNGKMQPKINYDYCKGCGLCAEECPAKALKMEIEKK